MTKREFLAKLKEALENDLDSYSVQENLAYYSSYIDDEISRGRGEAEVLEELGDPWVIAQSVIGMAEHRLSADEEYGGEEPRRGYWAEDEQSRYSEPRIHTYQIDSWWKQLLFILGIVGIVVIVFAIIGGLLSLIVPIIIPVLVVILVIRLLRRL